MFEEMARIAARGCWTWSSPATAPACRTSGTAHAMPRSNGGSFGADMPLPLQIRQLQAQDEALLALGRDPKTVGILWQTPIVVAETRGMLSLSRFPCQRPKGFWKP
jgi:hypothetical protein